MRDRAETAELTLHVHAETDRAIRVSDTGDDEMACWLPLSQVDVIGPARGHDGADVRRIDVPQWLAEKEGLV